MIDFIFGTFMPTVYKACIPCGDDEKKAAADGFCQQCEEYMCNTCFGHHRKHKLGRDHLLLGMNDEHKIRPQNKSAHNDGLDKCEQHNTEFVKFYCQDHDQVGCGDCIILEHKTCDIAYIVDKAKQFKDSKELQSFLEEVEHCRKHIHQGLVSSAEDSKRIEVIHAHFNAAVKKFRVELNQHLDGLEYNMLEKATAIRAKDNNAIKDLEKNFEALAMDVFHLQQSLQQDAHPSKIFVRTVQCKPKLKSIQAKASMKYKFRNIRLKRNSQIESTLRDCRELGKMIVLDQIPPISVAQPYTGHQLAGQSCSSKDPGERDIGSFGTHFKDIGKGLGAPIHPNNTDMAQNVKFLSQEQRELKADQSTHYEEDIVDSLSFSGRPSHTDILLHGCCNQGETTAATSKPDQRHPIYQNSTFSYGHTEMYRYPQLPKQTPAYPTKLTYSHSGEQAHGSTPIWQKPTHLQNQDWAVFDTINTWSPFPLCNMIPPMPSPVPLQPEKVPRERFSNAVGSNTKTCPECNMVLPEDIDQQMLIEHQVSHIGIMCPQCKMLKPNNMTDDEFTTHVNLHYEDDDKQVKDEKRRNNAYKTV